MHFENFQVGKPVTGKDFIGREEELKLMLQLLSQGQSIMLIDQRRYGKTSLVHEVLRHRSVFQSDHGWFGCRYYAGSFVKQTA